MTAVYLFCLVLGGGFAFLSAFGDLFDGGADADFDVDLDADALDAVDAIDGGDAFDAAHGDVGTLASILSIRSLIFAVFGFGATGSLLTLLGSGPAAPLTLLLSIGAGLAVGVAVGSFLAYLKRSDSGFRAGDQAFVGLAGRVTLPIGPGSPGRIAVLRGEREHAMRALPYRSEAAGDSAEWERVLVLEMRDGVAYVGPLDEENDRLLDPGPQGRSG